jgi:hypothetical protein
MIRVSITTERSTCRREAPRVRRVASSRAALGDGDGDGVEDHERADEQRDAAEHEQERAHAAEARGDLLGALSGLLIGGLEPAVGGQQRGQPAGELGLRNALSSGHVDFVESSLLVEDGLRGREVEGGEGEGADRGPAELAGAGDREAPERPVGLRGDRVAHLVVVLLRCGVVDHDLVGTFGPRARGQGHRAEARLVWVDAEAQALAVAAAECLAVAPDQPHGVAHAPCRGRDAGL